MTAPIDPRLEKLKFLVQGKEWLIIGVGNLLRGDDGVGSLISQELEQSFPDRVIDGQTVPENFLVTVLDRRPKVCLFIDAVDFGGSPGEWGIFSFRSVKGKLPTTHTMSLGPLVSLLEQEGIECWLIGIQPLVTEFGSPVSEAVDQAKKQLLTMLRRLLKPDEEGSSGPVSGER